jgi:hypothetical protein
MKIFKLLSVFAVGAFITSCRVSDTNNASPPPSPPPVKKLTGSERFESDLQEFSQLSIRGEDVDLARRGVFSKLFGGPTPQNVIDFVRLRAAHTHFAKEAGEFEASFYKAGEYLGDDTLKSALDIGKEDDDESGAVAVTVGVNYGTMLFNIVSHSDYTMVIHFPEGDVPVTSSRVGFIGLTKHYEVLPGTNFRMPIEGRVATLVHEGRHSDCPQIDGADGLCGYTHMKCPEDHELAGEYACDQRPFGSYGVEAIYMMSVVHNYPVGSQKNAIMQFLTDDLVGRIDDANWNLMEDGEPDLSSVEIENE